MGSLLNIKFPFIGYGSYPNEVEERGQGFE
jgi:hypothetical protein